MDRKEPKPPIQFPNGSIFKALSAVPGTTTRINIEMTGAKNGGRPRKIEARVDWYSNAGLCRPFKRILKERMPELYQSWIACATRA